MAMEELNIIYIQPFLLNVTPSSISTAGAHHQVFHHQASHQQAVQKGSHRT